MNALNQNFIDIVVLKNSTSTLKEFLLMAMGVLCLAIAAQLTIPLYPVPITAQSLVVLLIGASFGAKRAFKTTVLYVLAGVVGLPVFSSGSFGLGVLTGATGGYLVGFVIAATAMGLLGDLKKERTLPLALVSFFVGHIIIFATGLLGLSLLFRQRACWLRGFILLCQECLLKLCVQHL